MLNLEKKQLFLHVEKNVKDYYKHILFGTTLLAHVPESFSLSAE